MKQGKGLLKRQPNQETGKPASNLSPLIGKSEILKANKKGPVIGERSYVTSESDKGN